ncbi:hypothetical protein R1sor_004043 [Riccia sorocarpa]|uniref:Zinc finger C3HC4 RING-type domain-containing protein n=1 Tax=Riccia sorocarpa TaxID=122646 RepID=A0ABD3H7D7_9MARC
MAAVEGSGCGVEGVEKGAGVRGEKSSKKVVDFDRESKLDELARQMDLLQQKIEGLKREFQEGEKDKSGDPMCFACLEYKKGAALFPCGHTFCWTCTSRILASIGSIGDFMILEPSLLESPEGLHASGDRS